MSIQSAVLAAGAVLVAGYAYTVSTTLTVIPSDQALAGKGDKSKEVKTKTVNVTESKTKPVVKPENKTKPVNVIKPQPVKVIKPELPFNFNASVVEPDKPVIKKIKKRLRKIKKDEPLKTPPVKKLKPNPKKKTKLKASSTPKPEASSTPKPKPSSTPKPKASSMPKPKASSTPEPFNFDASELSPETEIQIVFDPEEFDAEPEQKTKPKILKVAKPNQNNKNKFENWIAAAQPKTKPKTKFESWLDLTQPKTKTKFEGWLSAAGP